MCWRDVLSLNVLRRCGVGVEDQRTNEPQATRCGSFTPSQEGGLLALIRVLLNIGYCSGRIPIVGILELMQCL
jgi:hypothetical protein